jgi:hypothetical protein
MKELECHSIFVITMTKVPANKHLEAHRRQNQIPSSSILRRFQLGKFFLRAIHVVLSCDSQLKKLLLTP